MGVEQFFLEDGPGGTKPLDNSLVLRAVVNAAVAANVARIKPGGYGDYYKDLQCPV